MKTLTASRIRTARVIAISADVLQIVFFPMFGEGFVSILDDALDAVVCVLLTLLVGWHYSFLPSFVIKVVPLADLVPTWTIAVLLATRRGAQPQTPPATDVYSEPAPPPQLKWPVEK